jgi:uncharacterized membrane-anchored protein YjiN (DUF445 family)
MATGVLAALAAVFLATHLVPDAPGWLRLVRAMAEAGMIGGLADWFAVEALFRHPLGIPIPHTALLPKNQARAAKNVGRFLSTHFLASDQVEARLRAAEPARHLSGWLAQRDNARAVAAELTGMLAGMLHHDPSPRALARARQWLREQVADAGSDAAIAGGVAELVKAGMRGGVADAALGLVRDAVDDNRERAVELVQDRSRWWIASTVDRRVADLVVNAVVALLDDLRHDTTGLRRDFEAAFEGMVDALEADGTLARAVAEGRRHLVASGAFDEMMRDLATGLRDRLAARLADDSATLADPLADMIRDAATRALADPTTRAAFDARLAELAGRALADLRPAIAGYVADVNAGWEPSELNARFEEEIGADLHFIRINGAVLGALIGGVLFGLNALMR